MSELEYVLNKFNIETGKTVIEIPDTDRERLADLFAELGYTKGAEVGVERGLYADVLLSHNSNLNLLAIDAWAAYSGYRDHVTQKALDDIYGECKELLSKYGDRAKMVRKYSMEALADVPDGSLDFVYIDANHAFEHVVNDISQWAKKVRIGGIISGHDYVKRTNKQRNYLMHVPMALHGFIESYEIEPVFVLGRKNAAPGERRDKPRSWFYVKQPDKPIMPGHKA